MNSMGCMLRYVDGRPKQLFVESSERGYVAIKPTPGPYDKPLWFPCEIVFESDDELFEKMTAAFESGNKERLNELWSYAKHLDLRDVG
jgi:hypothetical protein